MKGLRLEELFFRNIGPVNLSIAPGECVGLSGPSGIGKTLFLRAIADMDPHFGKLFLNDTESGEMPAHQWRKKVGLLPAESQWWADSVGGHFEGTKKEWFAALGFEMDVLTWRISRLSSGERQRLALLRLLHNYPGVLLLDEPTTNLDPESIEQSENLMIKYKNENNAPVIWVSHDTDQLNRVALRSFVMNNHNIIEK